MPYTNETIENTPMYVTRFQGEVTYNEFTQWTQELFTYSDQQTSIKGYHLISFVEASVNFADLIRIFTNTAREMLLHPQSSTHEVMIVLVGTHPLIKLAANMLRQPTFDLRITPLFRTLEDAFAFIRVDWSQRQNVK